MLINLPTTKVNVCILSMIELSSPAQLITANVSTMGVNPLALDDVEPPLRVTFTYSTKWIPTKYVP